MNDVIHKDLKKATEEKIKQLLEENQGDVNSNNLQALGDLLDMVKDIENIEYWCIKEEDNMYGEYGRRGRSNYGEYGRRGRDSYGRRERDSRGRYRGHDYIDDMYENYGRYEEGRQEYNRGNYGAKEDTLKGLEYMLESLVDFAEMLKHDANSQEEMEMVQKYYLLLYHSNC
jgi:hypothetical protein